MQERGLMLHRLVGPEDFDDEAPLLEAHDRSLQGSLGSPAPSGREARMAAESMREPSLERIEIRHLAGDVQVTTRQVHIQNDGTDENGVVGIEDLEYAALFEG